MTVELIEKANYLAREKRRTLTPKVSVKVPGGVIWPENQDTIILVKKDGKTVDTYQGEEINRSKFAISCFTEGRFPEITGRRVKIRWTPTPNKKNYKKP